LVLVAVFLVVLDAFFGAAFLVVVVAFFAAGFATFLVVVAF